MNGIVGMADLLAAHGVAAAPRLGEQGYLNLAAWRETGALLGVCVAAVAPAALDVTGDPYGNFALGFALVCALALWLMRRDWTAEGAVGTSGFGAVLSDAIARRLLLVALMNAAPNSPRPMLRRVSTVQTEATVANILSLKVMRTRSSSVTGWKRASPPAP